MKFFDRDWMNAVLTEAEYKARYEEYMSQLKLIRALLPPSLVELSQSGVLHDAQVETVQVDFAHGQLLIDLLGGDSQTGYRALHLRYDEIELDDASRVALQEATLDPTTELLYDELELLSDGRFEHRMLLWPHRELSVVFRNFDLVSTPRPNPKRRAGAPKYEEIR